MIKKVLIVLFILIIIFAAAGVFAANYIFDKYLAQPEVIEELVNGISEDVKNLESDNAGLKIVEDNLEKTPSTKATGSQAENLAAMQKNSDEKNKSKFEKEEMVNIDKSEKMVNNVKGSTKKIKVEPTDKARVIAILKASLTSSDIQELEQIAFSKPLTSEKIARAKEILRARLTREQKEELKAIYRKYYG